MHKDESPQKTLLRGLLLQFHYYNKHFIQLNPTSERYNILPAFLFYTPEWETMKLLQLSCNCEAKSSG